MKKVALPLVAGFAAALGCLTIPGQEVRYEPTPVTVVREMLELAEVGPQDIVYDLGSGDGRIPIVAAREFGARGVGVEINPALVARAQANARDAGVEDKVEFTVGDMYAADVRRATVVTLFLHPDPNLKLRPKLRSELRPGSRVVSYVWDMGDWAPEEVRRVNRHRIFLWRIPESFSRVRPERLIPARADHAQHEGMRDTATRHLSAWTASQRIDILPLEEGRPGRVNVQRRRVGSSPLGEGLLGRAGPRQDADHGEISLVTTGLVVDPVRFIVLLDEFLLDGPGPRPRRRIGNRYGVFNRL